MLGASSYPQFEDPLDLSEPVVVPSIDLLINTKDYFVREETKSSGCTMLERRQEEGTPRLSILLHGL